MDQWPGKHPYHCFPLIVASGFGWTLGCREGFSATWNGGPHEEDIVIAPLHHGRKPECKSHFGRGVLTFFINFLVRTEAPYQLFVSGPLNQVKRGISPLSAIVETSWVPYTFAMSYVFTEPNLTVVFEEDEPYCQFFPIIPEVIEQLQPECQDLRSNLELWNQFHTWHLARNLSNGSLRIGDSSPAYNHAYQQGGVAAEAPLAERPRRYVGREFEDRSTDQPLALNMTDPLDQEQLKTDIQNR